MSSLRLILNEPLPPKLRRALERDAKAKGVSLNDAAVEILSARFRTRYKHSGLPYRPSADRFKLRVPEDLHRKIRVEAARDHGTVRGVALNAIAEHYGLDSISTQRRPRRKVA